MRGPSDPITVDEFRKHKARMETWIVAVTMIADRMSARGGLAAENRDLIAAYNAMVGAAWTPACDEAET